MERKIYVDNIKAISIFLVVFCHYVLLAQEEYLGNIIMTICWAGVPCFLMATGAVQMNRPYKGIMPYIKKVVSVYMQLAIWKLLYLLFYIVINRVDVATLELKKTMQYMFLFSTLEGVADGHLYFMNIYMMAMLFMPVVCFLVANNGEKLVKYLTIIMLVAGQLVTANELIVTLTQGKWGSLSGLQNIMPWGGQFYYLIFVLLGGLLAKTSLEERIGKKWTIFVSCILFVFGVCGLLGIKYLQTGTLQWQGQYLQNGYAWCSTVVLTVGCFGLLQSIGKFPAIFQKLLSYLGKNTLGIYYLHVPLLVVCQAKIYPHIEVRGTWVNILKTIAAIILCCIVIEVGKVLKKIGQRVVCKKEV